MKLTHKAMHRIVGDAIAELRRTKDWSQPELAREISRRARRGTEAPPFTTISEWERGISAPAPHYRTALARIANSDKATRDLAPLFLASMNAWAVVSRVRLLHQRRHAPLQPKNCTETKGNPR